VSSTVSSARSGAELLDDVLRLARHIRTELVDHHDLTLRQFMALRALAGGSLRLGQLADAVEVRGPSAVALVDGLIAAGLVERKDARASLIELTRAGRRRMRGAQAHLAEMLESELARLRLARSGRASCT
jgi:DNA-binding MarR family transcriptional regulator